jgi:hypothetical protein
MPHEERYSPRVPLQRAHRVVDRNNLPSMRTVAQRTRERSMRAQNRRLPGMGRIRGTILLLCTVSMVGGCCDARPAARRAQCQANLRTLYDALVKYVSLYGDVPRGNDGKASLDPLHDPTIQREVGIDSLALRCPADENSLSSSYLLNPALSVRDLGHDSATVIACDRLPNHPGSRNSVAVVLIGDGATVVMDLPLKEQEEWRRLLLSGDKRACSVSMKDGSAHNWTSDGIRWYVGEK